MESKLLHFVIKFVVNQIDLWGRSRERRNETQNDWFNTDCYLWKLILFINVGRYVPIAFWFLPIVICCLLFHNWILLVYYTVCCSTLDDISSCMLKSRLVRLISSTHMFHSETLSTSFLYHLIEFIIKWMMKQNFPKFKSQWEFEPNFRNQHHRFIIAEPSNMKHTYGNIFDSRDQPDCLLTCSMLLRPPKQCQYVQLHRSKTNTNVHHLATLLINIYR